MLDADPQSRTFARPQQLAERGNPLAAGPRGCRGEVVMGLAVSVGEEFPVPLGDDLDVAVGHFDGALIVNRIRRTWDPGRPSFCVGHGVLRQVLVIHVREDRKTNDSKRFVITRGGLQKTKSSPMLGVITMLPALNPT